MERVARDARSRDLCGESESMPIRRCGLEDLEELVRLEARCFETDRLSRRNFRYLLSRANALTLVAEEGGALEGYAMLLFNTGTSLARLYSVAVDPRGRGMGTGGRLLEAAESAARDHDCVSMRLEVRADNGPAIGLYEKRGYRRFGVIEDYYEDHQRALRFEKFLIPHLEPNLVSVPFYMQTLDFTCGPSALMMAMKALDSDLEMDRKTELRIWRESTSIYMTSGHGGCGPYGLALSAYHRGFDVEVFVNAEGVLFTESVRSEEKKEVIRLVQEDMLEEIRRHPIGLRYGAPGMADIQARWQAGLVPLVLISSRRIYHENSPHWVVVTGLDDRFIYVHDSFVDVGAHKSATDSINMPILKKDFERMARYGRAGLKAALFIGRRPRARGAGADEG